MMLWITVMGTYLLIVLTPARWRHNVIWYGAAIILTLAALSMIYEFLTTGKISAPSGDSSY
jgi:hypothetical protein